MPVLQLRAAAPTHPAQKLALQIAEKHLELLASRDYTRLKNATGCSEEALRAAQRLIHGAQSAPGRRVRQDRGALRDARRDRARRARNVWRASLNPDAMPRLRINRLYAELAAGARASGNALSSQLQEARWLIKNVQQRFDTILRVSQAIVDRQRHFLEHGEVAMRPLVLREIAETLGLHESTISRVTTQKFMVDAARHLRAQVLLRQPRRHRGRRRGLLDRDPRPDQAAGRAPRTRGAAVGRAHLADPRRAGHRGGAPHDCQIPRVPADPPVNQRKAL